MLLLIKNIEVELCVCVVVDVDVSVIVDVHVVFGVGDVVDIGVGGGV